MIPDPNDQAPIAAGENGGIATPEEEAKISSLNKQFSQLYQTCYQTGKFAEAIPTAEKWLELSKKALGPDHPKTVTAGKNVDQLRTAVLYQGLLKADLEAFKELLKSDPPKIAKDPQVEELNRKRKEEEEDAEQMLPAQRARSRPKIAPRRNSFARLLARVEKAQARKAMFARLKRKLKNLPLNETQLREKALACFEAGKISYGKHAISADYEAVRDAVEQLKQAIELDPNYVEALSLLGEAYVENRNYDEGYVSFQQALSIDPQCIEAYLGLASAIWNKSGWSSSLIRRYYGKALELAPDNVTALKGLARYYQEKGDYAEQIRIRQKLPHCDSIQNVTIIANAYAAAGQYDEGIAICRQAIERQPDSADAFYCLAEVFCAKGDYLQALANYNEAVKRHLGYRSGRMISGIYFRLGEASANSGDYDSAISYYERSVSCDDSHKSEGELVPRQRLAYLYRLKGDDAKVSGHEIEIDQIEYRCAG
jgi:tetratricopeptide (TPR) repeat protein